jgi:hypothetical protein
VAITEGLITSIGYEVLKKVAKSIFSNDDDPILNKVFNVIIETEQKFYKKYDNEFGDPNNNFLAHEENNKKILESVFFRNKNLSVEDINPNGYKNTPKATIEAVKYFINNFYYLLN